jgi:UTP--glucose-1-phosphate uridylyltransferase
MRVNKAILPAAGLGTRFLPATKAMPKEMLPLVDKPIIQYAVEEACASDVSDLIVVTGRGKAAIEDHFDLNVELEQHLRDHNHVELANSIRDIAQLTRIAYVRQHRPLGLGHAVLQAGYLVGREPCAVLLADDVIISEEPCLAQLLAVFEQVQETVVALMEVPWEAVAAYGIASSGEHFNIAGRRTVKIKQLVEKPARGSAPSNLAVIGRYILHPAVFDALSTTPPGRDGEIQLTDALQEILGKRSVYGVLFSGRRYDAGSKLGFLEAAIAIALQRSDIGPGMIGYLNDVVTLHAKTAGRHT